MLIAAAFALLLAPDDASVGIHRAWVAQDTVLAKPEFQKITASDGWQTFWKGHVPHAGGMPQVNFDAYMVLVIPSVLPSDVLAAPPPSGTPEVEARITEKALKVQARMTLRPPDKKSKSSAATRTVLTIVALPICPLPVEFRLTADEVDLATSTHPGGGTPEPAAGRITVRGRLVWVGVEGGTWSLAPADKKYDLHLMPPGFKKEDLVEIVGREPAGVGCIHMWGRIFFVETIRRVE